MSVDLSVVNSLIAYSDASAVVSNGPIADPLLYLCGVAAFWAVTAVVVAFATYKSASNIDAVLSVSRGRHRTFAIVVSGIIPLAATICVEGANISDVIRGDLYGASLVPLTLLGPVTWIFIAGQYILWFHDDNWGLRLNHAERMRDEARLDRDFVALLNKTQLHCVLRHTQQIQKALRNGSDDKPVKLPALHKALSPENRVIEMVVAAHKVMDSEVTKTFPGEEVAIRAALFRVDPQGRRLELVYDWNGVGKDCTQSPRVRNQERFELTNVNECLAVYAAVHGEIMIIPDAEAAHGRREDPFNFFDVNQRNSIGSILAVPLSCGESINAVRFVLCLDANKKNVFCVERNTHYSKLAENLAPRLQHALLVKELLQRLSISQEGTKP